MLHKLPTELLDQVVRELVVPFDTPVLRKTGFSESQTTLAILMRVCKVSVIR